MSAYHTPSAETNPPELVAGRCKGASTYDVELSRFNKGSAARLWRLIPVKNALQVEFTIVDDQVRNLSRVGEEAELFRSKGWINKISLMRSPNNQLGKWNLRQISEFEINSSIMANNWRSNLEKKIKVFILIKFKEYRNNGYFNYISWHYFIE